MEGYILNALLDTSGDVLADLEQTVATWNHKVEFKVHLTFKKDARVNIFTYDLPWNWLDQGTANRYAIMSRDFVPKTTPGSFQSGHGAGRLIRIGRRSRGPIRPRGWTIMAINKHTKVFNQRVVAAVAKGFASFE